MFVLDEEKRLKIAVNRLLRAREEKGVLAKGVYTTIAKDSGVGVRALMKYINDNNIEELKWKK